MHMENNQFDIFVFMTFEGSFCCVECVLVNYLKVDCQGNGRGRNL